MKKLLFLLFAISSAAAFGQQTPSTVLPNATIERVDISGVPESRLSADLRADIQKLVGQIYNAEAANQLAEGIQIELPEYVAAATPQPGSQQDRIRLIFVVAKISDNDALKTNINSRYIVDAVEVEGKYKAKISEELNADLQKMVGQNLDTALAEKLGKRIQKENAPADLMVERKLRRGASPQHVKLIYDVHRAENNISGSGSFGYHSKEGFTLRQATVTLHHLGIGAMSFKIANDSEDLIERFAGMALGYRVGRGDFSLYTEYSSYRAQWKPNTLQADAQSAQSPGLYRLRDTLSASGQFKLPLSLGASAGVSFGELQMQSPVRGFQKNNVFTGSLSSSYRSGSEAKTDSQSLDWAYRVTTGTRSIDSDFVYVRHSGEVNYYYRRDEKAVIHVKLLAGRTTGNAPMVERFSLGNATTLRGWTKYEIAPLGGNRVAHGSVEYTYKVLTLFYDSGSVWDAGRSSTFRQSVGLTLSAQKCKGIASLNPGCYLPITLGFPIHNNGRMRPVFMVGF